MLRAFSSIYIESQALELLTSRRDVFKLFRTFSTGPASHQTVLTSEAPPPAGRARPPASVSPPASGHAPPPPPPPPRRSWTVAAATLAFTASVGGVYFYQRFNDADKEKVQKIEVAEEIEPAKEADEEEPYPADAEQFPEYVEFLMVGAGTASFAAMRAVRSARPDAQVLLVGAEPAPPYMRPPLSKEAWREPRPVPPAGAAAASFRQWNGKRRALAYEPLAFYAPVERLRAGAGGASVARGWRVVRLDLEAREARLEAAGGRRARVRYGQVLWAGGARARRLAALGEARAAGAALALRSAGDAARLAAALDAPAVKDVLLVGGGLLGCELSAALAERLRERGVRVWLAVRGATPLGRVLPAYLARDAARRLEEAGVHLLLNTELIDSSVVKDESGEVRARVTLAEGGAGGAVGAVREMDAQVVVECVGAEAEDEAAAASGLETHGALGGLVVNAELQARAGVFAAGDAACYHGPRGGRQRREHHDHAVLTGRLAGENMLAAQAHLPPKPYTDESMFWSDLGPALGYEAIGIIDSKLPTVGVFSAEAVTEETPPVEAAAGESLALPAVSAAGDAGAGEGHLKPAGGEGEGRRYERGVVFYLQGQRVVGVLMWNLFNRMHVARQVLVKGEFEDLFEVAKLFSLHEDD